MFNRIPTVEVCDATGDDSSTADDLIKNTKFNLTTISMFQPPEFPHRGTGGRATLTTKACLCIAGILLSLSSIAQWPAVTQNAKPWTRWWWMGSAVDQKNISSLMTQYSNNNLGGVEVVPIYGAIGYENQYIPYLSARWLQMLDYTVQQSKLRNMGVYLAVGTGWPIGGPQVRPDDGASKLFVQNYTITDGRSYTGKIELADPRQKGLANLSALIAYGSKGEVLDITSKVTTDNTLGWDPPVGDWQLVAAFSGKTRQQVKRAAPGGEGPVLDHFSKGAVNNYFKNFDASFGNTSHGVQVMYNDSYEVFDADWTPSFFSEFKARRGYDLRTYLRQLTSKETSDTVARLKSDYRQTMSDMMLHNFSEQFNQWSHDKKTLSLNQAHGSPGHLLDLYAAVDIPECETFGSSYFPVAGLRRDSGEIRNVDPDPNMLKFASSAAHVMGKPFVTCETFTWLGEHFKTAPSQCKAELEQVFLSGVNHMFYHGTTYSPAEAAWPGWLFYASLNMVPANSLWKHFGALNQYITRCQSVLQAGKPDNEILAYWPVYDAWQNAKGMDFPFRVHNIDDWLHPTPFYKNVVALQKKGYSMDFVSDSMLSIAQVTGSDIRVTDSGGTYKIILVPQVKYMPAETLQSLLRLADAGATVIMQGFPQDVPGFYQVPERRQQLLSMVQAIKSGTEMDGVKEVKRKSGRIIISNDVEQALTYARMQRETLTDAGLKFIRRSINGGKYYFIVNHTANAIDQQVTLPYSAASVIIMDPQSGRFGSASFTQTGKGAAVRLQLQSGEAVIVKVTDKKQAAAAWSYYEPTGKVIELSGGWDLSFKEGGPVLPPARKMAYLQPWTAFSEDTTLQNFSGTGVYTTTFSLPGKKADDYLLQLGKVNESARVIVNGKEAGIAWNLPFELHIGQYLKPGTNTIAIEVANLMANRIRYMDRKGMKWRAYHEINFVNINYKPFDASVWKVQPSGLEGPVRIMPLQRVK